MKRSWDGSRNETETKDRNNGNFILVDIGYEISYFCEYSILIRLTNKKGVQIDIIPVVICLTFLLSALENCIKDISPAGSYTAFIKLLLAPKLHFKIKSHLTLVVHSKYILTKLIHSRLFPKPLVGCWKFKKFFNLFKWLNLFQ